MEKIKTNIFSGITVAIVALPLALAFGVASGAGAAAGLYGAIIVGLFAALFGGTKTQISGPTGPMTIVMASVLLFFNAQSPEHGMALSFTVVFLGGLFQFLFGLLHIGKYIILVAYPVISGFMSGIGLIIIFMQLGPFLGYEAGTHVIDILISLPKIFTSIDMVSLIVGSVTLATMYIWPDFLKRYIPSPLAAIMIGTLLYLIVFPNSDISRIGEIALGFPSFKAQYWDFSLIIVMIKYALLLAGLGAIDSLLTSLVADNMTGTKHNSDKELIGQGIGNMVASFFGALPGAGATMRTVTNIKAGGSDPISGVAHLFVLAIIAFGAGGIVESIPYAALAGLLIKVGIDIIDWRFLKRLHKLPLFSQCLMASVMLITVFYDLMTAVVIGIFITNMVTIDRLTKLQLNGVFLSDGKRNHEGLDEAEKNALIGANGKTALLKLEGAMSFGIAEALKHLLDDFTNHETLIIDFGKSSIVGITATLVLEDMIKN
ncbi:MAG: SulP family inorganic anion transporter [Proteobacteria bacterium]|nr:SulP family inorganic anion transporter [Pseudomonadota bacterium]